jgi:CBS domain-containing protein
LASIYSEKNKNSKQAAKPICEEPSVNIRAGRRSTLPFKSLGVKLVVNMSKEYQAMDVARKNVITCQPDEDLRFVAKLMVDHWISSVIVVERDKPVGIVTDGIIFRLIAKGRNPLNLVASDVMVSPVHTIPMNTTLEEAVKAFKKTKVNRLAIVNEGGKLVGIITKKDVDRYEVYSVAERLVQRRHLIE